MRIGFLAAIAVICATPARADLTFCNDGALDRQVAIAYSDNGVWTSEGWWKVPSGTCKVAVAGDLARQHYYYHAPLNGAEPEGDFSFCVTDQAFTIPGADGDCAALGAEKQRFGHIDTGKTAKDFTFTLTEDPAAKPTPDPAPAETAAQADDPAAAASFDPGTHGEPFTVNALVQGCEPAEAGGYCVFYAEGYRWAAMPETSNPAALAQLGQVPVNTPLIVTGDIIGYGDITAEAAVSRIEPGTPDAWAALREAMQGSWVSVDDPLSKLHIFGSEQSAEYDGQALEVSVMTWADACPGGETIGPVVYTQVMGGDPMDTPCHAILQVTADRMDLSYVGRGNTLSYTRVMGGE